ncbi:hypothetical protein HDU81_008288 [Chytriomyces hyalinus]|nr:hypothetical protein HDU81_008288 [Chytriomyces hyalinus]
MLNGSQHSRVTATRKRPTKSGSSSAAVDSVAKNETEELMQNPEAEMITKALNRRETPRARFESISESELSDEISRLFNPGSRKPAGAKQVSKETVDKRPGSDRATKESGADQQLEQIDTPGKRENFHQRVKTGIFFLP